MKPLILAALIFAAGPAASQQADSLSESGSQSYSGVNIEASRSYRHAPSMGASAIPTADCLNATSGAVSGPGFGIAFGGGNGNRACNTRANAAMLQALAGDAVALAYVCQRDDEMRTVLTAQGLCGTATAATAPRTRLVCPASHPVYVTGRGCRK